MIVREKSMKGQAMIRDNRDDSIACVLPEIGPSESSIERISRMPAAESRFHPKQMGIILIGQGGDIAYFNKEAESVLSGWKEAKSVLPFPKEIPKKIYQSLLKRHGHLSPVLKKLFQSGRRGYSFTVIPLFKPGSALDDSEIMESMVIFERIAADTLPFSLLANQYKLSPREVDVAKLLVLGKSDKIIKRDLGISIHTVREHLRHIREKMGVCSRLEIVSLLLHR
jgi:DNA-binding CsgD family transcriptional regulator